MAMPTDTLDQIVAQTLKEALAVASARHKHLCPRQVLGARCAIAAAGMLELEVPRKDKRMLVIVETDGCFVDGVEAVAGVSVGGRTLRVEDYGKIGATFVDVKTERALRVAPQIDVRARARDYAPEQTRRYFAMLYGYQRMPDDELLTFEWVKLSTPVAAIVSRASARAKCDKCGEEIINEREVEEDGRTLCRNCAGDRYYTACKRQPEVGLDTPGLPNGC